MNVLVYSGPEIIQISLNHALATLKSVLLPNYTIQTVTQNTLTTQPWQSSCALLVLPRTRHRFVSVANKYIKEFVEGGGKYLMLSTSASAIPRSVGGLGFGATGLSLGPEAGEIPLKFFDKTSNAYIACAEEATEARVDARVVDLRASEGAVARGIYDTEAAQFQGFDELKETSVVARYLVNGSEASIAGLTISIGKGRAAFWGPSIEYPLSEEPTSSLLASTTLMPDEITSSEKIREELLASTLSQLGLKVPTEEEKTRIILRPLPQFLTSIPSKPTIVNRISDAITGPPPLGEQLTAFKDANDDFRLHPLAESTDLLKSAREEAKTPSDPSTWQPKYIVICRDGTVPEKSYTPLFDLNLFYSALESCREKEGLPVFGPEAETWGMGEAVIYGEAVTSTQTMLDKNPKLLTQLPVPLLSIASHQLAGRGRGGNIWLSPAGCLQFSLTLRVSLDTFPANKLVFVQYLFALAVAEACCEESMLGETVGQKVRLKWPNDLYAVTGPNKDDLKKIGGILINTSFSGGKVDIIIGCGVNILNPPPITSLSQLQPDSCKALSMERSAATIMAKFEGMWSVFVRERGSFAPFCNSYLTRWLHSDQVVTLTTTTPHALVRITGITLDHGLLRTVPERSGTSRYSGGDDDYIDLQPDGNSFDLMANMIKTKS